jgi:hypothetical protein
MIQTAFKQCCSLSSQVAAHPFIAELQELSPRIYAADQLTFSLVKEHVS